MAQELATPEFTVDQKIATFLASCGLLSDAWKESLRACEISPESFTLSEYKDVVYVAFPPFHRIEDFIVEESPYGEGSIQTGDETFSGCLKGKDDKPASVHQGALKLFLHILKNTDLEAKNDIARTSLKSAGKIEKRDDTITSQLAIKLSTAQSSMAELEWYKEHCEKKDGITYYDSFKGLGHKRDIHANMCRVKLTDFWDEIIEMWEKHELPIDFQTRKKWTYAGNTYSRLVEPLDIADYYRITHSKGNYLSDGRPTRHKVLQKWFKEKENTRSSEDQKARTKLPSLTVDSCFWAHVEEALKDLKQSQQQEVKCFEKFEDYVTKMIQDHKISSDVFRKESSFMKWWQEYQEIQSSQWKISSELCKIMESERWKE